MTKPESEIHALIQESSLSLDRGDFSSYLQLFSEAMRYRVVAYSPELRKDMVWLDHDQAEMKHLFKMLPQHVTLPGTFFRHTVVGSIEEQDDGWRAVSSLMLIYTDPNGSSRLMAVGRYQDDIEEQGDRLRLTNREVRLETRDLGPGIQVPL